MASLFSKLHRIQLLSIKGMYLLLGSIRKHGPNLMFMLRFSAKLYPNRTAIKDGERSFTYLELLTNAQNLALNLADKNSIDNSKKVAFICRNHGVFIQALIAVSRLGSKITLINTEISKDQVAKILEQVNFDLVIYDNDLSDKIPDSVQRSIPCFRNKAESIEEIVEIPANPQLKLKRQKSGNLSVLTGGTSGRIKFAKRKPSVKASLYPFLALVHKINLHEYDTVYTAVPLYHGYGLASFFVTLILGKETILRPKFSTEEALKILKEDKVDVLVLVPTLLHRMLNSDKESMKQVKVILTGGAPLSQALAKQTTEELGPVLNNLYGTSEAGFSVLALPEDLKKHPDSIGKPIKGVSMKILDKNSKAVKTNETGILHIRTSWAMSNMNKKYQTTGDMAYMNGEGYLFLRGRTDDMVISGGVNVYPQDLELNLLQNPHIQSAAVIAIDDEDFGKRLNAFVELEPELESMDSEGIKAWLKPRIARYQMPHRLFVVESIPTTITGKSDKKALIEIAKRDLN